MSIIYTSINIFLLYPSISNDPHDLVVEEFAMTYEFRGDRIHFSMEAPSSGWIVLGINDRMDIVGSYLVFGFEKNGFSHVEDHYVTFFEDHQSLFDLGEGADLKDADFTRVNEVGKITFSLPVQNTSEMSLPFAAGNRYYIWMARSNSNDPDHHSVKRVGAWITLAGELITVR